MAMFAGGVVVVLVAETDAEYVLGSIAILGAIAVVVANVNGKTRR